MVRPKKKKRFYGFIRLIVIQRAGRKAMMVREFLNGRKVKIGSVINEKK